jgi:hypothetical protein
MLDTLAAAVRDRRRARTPDAAAATSEAVVT